MNEKVAKALNHQINRELYSAYLYLGMSAYASSIGRGGFANWFKIQTQEELTHADKIYNYVNQQGARVALEPIEEPPQDFSSAVELFERTLEHERKVTGMIRDLVELAREEKDRTTEDFLQWFVKEQVEEERNPAKVLQKLALAEKDSAVLTSVDRELAART